MPVTVNQIRRDTMRLDAQPFRNRLAACRSEASFMWQPRSARFNWTLRSRI